MKKLSVLLILSASAVAANAQTIGKWYGEASYQMQSLEDTSSDGLGKFKVNSLSLTVGNVVANNFAVEGFYTLPSSSATNDYTAPATLT